jgi:hypothetical protein
MRAFQAIVLARLFLAGTDQGQSPAPELTAEERALCHADAIKFYFFKIGRAEALRQCLRDNRENLSAPCAGLLASRGN